jgi:hypothetical protein
MAAASNATAAASAATERIKRRDLPKALVPRKPAARSRVSNGTEGSVQPGVDQRSSVARRFRDIIADVVIDLGGPDHVTATRLHLVRRFAAQVCLAEGMEARYASGEHIDVGRHCKISSTLTRLAQRIGLKRVPRNVTPHLHDYIHGTSSSDEAAP